jgi:hypothetical protein
LTVLSTPERQDLSEGAAGLIAARNRLVEAKEVERAAVAAIGELGRRNWASKGAAGGPRPRWTVDGDGRRLIPVYKKGADFPSLA